jgi:hypothetical protein
LAIDSIPFALLWLYQRHCERSEAIHTSVRMVDCFAALAMTPVSIFILLLLLLLLLIGIDHAPLGERNRLAQHIDVTDVVGQDQHQRGVEFRALLVTQSAMRLDNSAKGVIRLGEI